MSDTFFTAAPGWTWFIIPYFFIGGLAGGAYFIAALLTWFGRPADRPVIRSGYYVAFIGVVLSGCLLILDLTRPERFWHMLFQSENFPALMFKGYSPISFGAWMLLAFSGFATLSALGAWAEEGRAPARFDSLSTGAIGRWIAAAGGVFGLAFAGYTGILLSVTNRPIWADSVWLGALFLASGVSTGAAALILLARRREAEGSLVEWLSSFDSRVLMFELLLLVIFLVSLGPVVQVWLSGWGVVLVLGVVIAGILVPILLHYRPGALGRTVSPEPVVAAAALVLVGGFLLRLVTLLASHGIEATRVAGGP
jgi:formate-dependent nitrite reductase membrane component NrfD